MTALRALVPVAPAVVATVDTSAIAVPLSWGPVILLVMSDGEVDVPEYCALLNKAINSPDAAVVVTPVVVVHVVPPPVAHVPTAETSIGVEAFAPLYSDSVQAMKQEVAQFAFVQLKV